MCACVYVYMCACACFRVHRWARGWWACYQGYRWACVLSGSGWAGPCARVGLKPDLRAASKFTARTKTWQWEHWWTWLFLGLLVDEAGGNTMANQNWSWVQRGTEQILFIPGTMSLSLPLEWVMAFSKWPMTQSSFEFHWSFSTFYPDPKAPTKALVSLGGWSFFFSCWGDTSWNLLFHHLAGITLKMTVSWTLVLFHVYSHPGYQHVAQGSRMQWLEHELPVRQSGLECHSAPY